MKNSSIHLRRVAIGYFIAGLSFTAFGFPFWFLNAVDKIPKGRFYPPFFYVVDNWLTAPVETWSQVVTSLGLFIGAVSLWQAGEPIGFGKTKRLLVVPMAGAICYFLCNWVVLPFAPMGAVLNGLGMILVGVSTLKAKIWTDWKRYTPLIVGLFPFVFMFPLRFLTGARPAALIGLWGGGWLALGLAAWQRAGEISSQPGPIRSE